MWLDLITLKSKPQSRSSQIATAHLFFAMANPGETTDQNVDVQNTPGHKSIAGHLVPLLWSLLNQHANSQRPEGSEQE